MAWRGERWADVVRRARSAQPHKAALPEREDPELLAARAQPWTVGAARVEPTDDGLVLGSTLQGVEVAFAQLYHVEPVDPWPSLALGWVDRGESCSTVMTPPEPEAETFARAVEHAVAACEQRIPSAVARGWLDVPVHVWERVDAMPREREGRAMHGYRMAPEAPDPIVAERTTQKGEASLWGWVWARLSSVPRRVEPREIVLTKRFVYVRTRSGLKLRIDGSTLRTARKTSFGDAVYVFGRSTELLVVHQGGCALATALEARIAPSADE